MQFQDGDLLVNMPLLRHYLRNGSPGNGEELMTDYFLALEPGAGEILKFCLQLRGNPRTRRS